MKTVITFDFDGTLGHLQYVQKLAQVLALDPYNDVHIVTRRWGYVHPTDGDEMTQVFALAKSIGIKQDNIHFTNREYKVNTLQKLESDIHYDDDRTEISLIRQHYPKCKGFLVM